MDLILEYNRKISDPDLPKEEKCIFLEDIRLPEGVDVVQVV
jgi:hypothetical protein